MPARRDLRSICVVGSGPIVIGQACEFDYAGCQALKVLREDGYRTIVVNSNPATIMTDPGFADRTYIEPLDLEGVADVLRRERPDALLPTLGGQTALNLAVELETAGVLEELGVELLGARIDVIRRAEDRQLFREAVQSCGLSVPASVIVESLEEMAYSRLQRSRSFSTPQFAINVKDVDGKRLMQPEITFQGDGDEPPIDARNGPSLKEQVEAFERGLVARALDATGGNQSEAARRLGVSRVTLIDKMKKYGLGPKR